jgi:GPH family glycoside/pentoside/hexuronide:cation symporter
MFINVMAQFLIGYIGINIYYSKYVLNNVYLISVFSLFYFLPNFVGFAIMPLFIRRYGKRNTVLAGFFGFLLFSLCLHTLAGMNIALILTFVSLRGVALAPLLGSVYAFTYDTIEYGEWKYGTRIDAFAYSAASFAQKFGLGLGAAMVGWILHFGHYNMNLTTQASETVNIISMAFIWIPCLAYGIVAAILIFWKIDKLWPRIISDLKARMEIAS